jgi:hypothetical protein
MTEGSEFESRKDQEFNLLHVGSGREVDHSLSASTEAKKKNAGLYNYPIRLHGIVLN